MDFHVAWIYGISLDIMDSTYTREQRLVFCFFFLVLAMITFTHKSYTNFTSILPLSMGRVLGLHWRKATSTLAPQCYTVKRSIFLIHDSTTHPNLVSLCSDHFCACRKKYPIQIYAYQLKISALGSSKWEGGRHFVLCWLVDWSFSPSSSRVNQAGFAHQVGSPTLHVIGHPLDVNNKMAKQSLLICLGIIFWYVMYSKGFPKWILPFKNVNVRYLPWSQAFACTRAYIKGKIDRRLQN